MLDSSDIAILATVAVITAGFFYWRSASSGGSGKGVSVSTKSTGPSAGAKASPATAKKSSKKSAIDRLNAVENPNKLVIFYGSQTGTSEDLATRISKEVATSFGVHTMVCDLEEYDMAELSRWPSAEETAPGKILVGFFLATYGEGEPTDNAIEFYDWLLDGRGKGDDEEVDFEDDMTAESVGANLNYFIFGLGNKTYEHFNAMSRRVDKRLRCIGAKRVGPAGEGDDDGSMEDDFLNWKPTLLDAISNYFGVKASSGRENPHVPMFQVIPVKDISPEQTFHGEIALDNKPRMWKKVEEQDARKTGGEKYTEISTKKRLTYSIKNPYYSRVAESRQLFKSTYDDFIVDKDVEIPKSSEFTKVKDKHGVRLERFCVHMEFDLEGSGLKYESGDHVGVLSHNRDTEVAALAKALHLTDAQLDEPFSLQPNNENPQASSAKIPFPNPCSLRTAFTQYLAITLSLKQYQLEILAKYASSEAERDALYELCDNRELFHASIEYPQKNLAEVLSTFKSIKVPIAVVVGELLVRITPRFYSISSSAKKEPTKVSVTAVVVRYVLPSPEGTGAKKVVYKEGLATSMINRLHASSVAEKIYSPSHTELIPTPPLHVPIFIRTSSFRLPRDVSVPVIMIGPGTGVAPFRGFCRERLHVAESLAATAKPVGPTWLFYGCRHEEQDYLYRDEFVEMSKTVEGWKAAGDHRAFDLKLINAFSRQGDQKVYVQHRLKEYAEDVWKLVNEKRGYIYVCGDAKNMATDVHEQLLKMAMEQGGKTEDGAKAWIKNLRGSSRYQEDVW